MKKAVKYLVSGTIGVILGMLTSDYCVSYAEEVKLVNGTGARVLSIEQLLQSYEWYSDSCAKVRSDLYLTALEEENAYERNITAWAEAEELRILAGQLEGQKEELERMKRAFEEHLRELSESDGTIDVSEQKELILQELEKLEKQIEAYEEQSEVVHSKRTAQEMTVLDAGLTWKETAFYKEHAEIIKKGRIEELKYGILSEVLNLSLLKKQREYYECQTELIELEQKANKVRIRFGIAGELEEKELSRRMCEAETLLTEIENTKESTVWKLKEEAQLGTASVVWSYEIVEKEYGAKEILSRLRCNEEAYLQMGYYSDMYREYESDLPENQRNLKRQVDALAENYALQERLLDTQLLLYAEDKVVQYKQLHAKYKEVQDKQKICEKKYSAECKKLEYGRATEISVLNCKAELLGAEAECLQYVVELVKLEYLLDRGMFVGN